MCIKLILANVIFYSSKHHKMTKGNIGSTKQNKVCLHATRLYRKNTGEEVIDLILRPLPPGKNPIDKAMKLTKKAPPGYKDQEPMFCHPMGKKKALELWKGLLDFMKDLPGVEKAYNVNKNNVVRVVLEPYDDNAQTPMDAFLDFHNINLSPEYNDPGWLDPGCDNQKTYVTGKNNPSPVYEKKKKKTIPKPLKLKVWDKWMGEDTGKAKCLCCKLTDIRQASFHCGHIIAEAAGGELKVDNLKPICQLCNSSMGTTNMDEFISKYGF